MSELNERLQRQHAAAYAPNAELDAQLRWSTERINSELSPAERLSWGDTN